MHITSGHLTNEQSVFRTHIGQHSPGGVTDISSLEQNITGQSPQFGVQYGCCISSGGQNFLVHAGILFGPQKQLLQPSKNPFGHVSQPTRIIYINCMICFQFI